MREPELSARRLRTWIRLLRMTRSTETHLREYLRVNHDTTLPRFDVMAALHRHEGPMKMSDLSRSLLVSNGNATAVVDRLEKDGLAQRVQSETDRRAVLVTLTDAGRTEFEAQAVVDLFLVGLYFQRRRALRCFGLCLGLLLRGKYVASVKKSQGQYGDNQSFHCHSFNT